MWGKLHSSFSPLSLSLILGVGMFGFFPPLKKPTPSEYAVLVVFVSAVFIILGVVALIVGFRAPTEKHDLAVALEIRGLWCLGIGMAIGIGFWLIRRMMD